IVVVLVAIFLQPASHMGVWLGAFGKHDCVRRADEGKMRPLAAHSRLGLGTLYRSAGEPGRVREHLAQAMELYRDMRMATWLDKPKCAGSPCLPDLESLIGPYFEATAF